MPFDVYIIVNPDKHICVEQTNDVKRRVVEHHDSNNKNSKYTKRFSGPWRLIHTEQFATRSEAMKREKQLKTNRGRDWIRESFLKNQ